MIFLNNESRHADFGLLDQHYVVLFLHVDCAFAGPAYRLARLGISASVTSSCMDWQTDKPS